MKKSVIISICVVALVLIITFFIGKGITGADRVWEKATYTRNTELGEGEKTFSVKVIVGKDNVTFTIHTDKETVGEALVDNNLIEGEEGPYGLYVKYVNGMRADYDMNKTYWAFSKDSKPLETGVDMTKIEDGAQYELTYTK
ncbi:MAG: DUF4430 domain-containing protein [Clostridia bacterium]|nr:DUF4430 domain-containing protein [Clostridia bacterium]